MTTTTKKSVRMSQNSRRNSVAEENGKKAKANASKFIVIPDLIQAEIKVKLVGFTPLMVNNKLSVAQEISDTYGGDPSTGGKINKKPKPSKDEQYAKAFYVMPSSKYKAPHPKAKYGIPTSGIKKCVDAAIRTTGITDNTTIGNIAKSYQLVADEAGMTEIKFKRLERDIRFVNIGSGQKTVPDERHRPMFHDWSAVVRVIYNPLIIAPEGLLNLFKHAGQYIGWGELRAQKKQGECGGFSVESV